MYRALAYYAYSKGISVNDVNAVKAMIKGLSVDVRYDKTGTQHVYVAGNDVAAFIREHKISKLASDISKIPEVRVKLVEEQRRIAREKDVVLDGRDTTSYVLPDASYKFYLTAAEEERARRRYAELLSKGGTNFTYGDILRDIRDRDYNDTHRDFAPLVQTEDSIVVDTTNLNIDAVLNQFLKYIQQ
jgi:cytidylate kinase